MQTLLYTFCGLVLIYLLLSLVVTYLAQEYPRKPFHMNLFYRNRLKDVSPAKLAPSIRMPVLIIHGARDRRFPLEFALKLKNCFPLEQAELFVAENARHSESSLDPGYPDAVQRFIDRHLDGSGHRKSSA